MPTVKLWTDAEVSANPRIQAVFDDIRAPPENPISSTISGEPWPTSPIFSSAPGPASSKL